MTSWMLNITRPLPMHVICLVKCLMGRQLIDESKKRVRRAVIAGLAVGPVLLLKHLEVLPAAAGPAPNAMAEAEAKRAARQNDLCSAANATGTGLRGEYFARTAGKGEPLLVRVDATIDFDSSFEWPAQRASQRPGAVRWTGWVKPPVSGRYRFHLDQPSARVLVSRQVLAGEGAAPDSAIELEAGRFYPVLLEVDRLESISGRLRFEWTAPHGARYLVPRALLFTPSETVKAGGS
jgi:hypothetical protein